MDYPPVLPEVRPVSLPGHFLLAAYTAYFIVSSSPCNHQLVSTQQYVNKQLWEQMVMLLGPVELNCPYRFVHLLL